MKALCVIAVAGLALAGSMGAPSAQPYGSRGDYGYRDDGYRGRDDGYRGRDRYRDDDYGDRPRRRDYGFDAQEYLRCNPDVRVAVQRGQMESAEAHYRVFGRREGRRLSC